MKTKTKILMVEHDAGDIELIQHELKKGKVNYIAEVVQTRKDFEDALHNFEPDIILSDHSLPSFNSIDALKICQETGKRIPFILVTATVSEEFAVDMMRQGAYDYMLKDRLQRLPNAVYNTLEKRKLENERQKFLEEVIALNESLETKVSKRTAQLQEINNDLESFGYSVSHDLRSPLQVINGYSSILSKKYSHNLDEEAQKLIQGIKSYTKQMSLIMESLLNLSRLGLAHVEKTTCRTNEMVKAVIAELKLANKDVQVQIKVQDMPDAGCDWGLMKQVWINLISNAIKYSKQKKLPLIEIGSNEVDDEVVYFVKDNGMGFDMKYAGKLFKPFRRLHNAYEFEGIGIGLAIVHRIITKHGGRIWAEGKPDKGATFYFTLSPLKN